MAGANGVDAGLQHVDHPELDSDHRTGFDIAEDGTLSNSRVSARVAGLHGGRHCMDAKGAIWFGSVWTHEFFRVAEGGKDLDHIELDKCGIAPVAGGRLGQRCNVCDRGDYEAHRAGSGQGSSSPSRSTCRVPAGRAFAEPGDAPVRVSPGSRTFHARSPHVCGLLCVPGR